MTAYQVWTLTCNGCGRIFDNGSAYSLVEVKRDARDCGWRTGMTRRDDDFCSVCVSIGTEAAS